MRRTTRASSFRSCRWASCPSSPLPISCRSSPATSAPPSSCSSASRSPPSAREAGIVNAVVPDADIIATAEKAARALAALPAESLRLTKALLKKTHTSALEARIAEETRIFAERLASPDAKAAMSAFLEKRK
jgi:Enoyl-CoA hydratase/isomerase